MTLEVCPKSMLESTAPAAGIFWALNCYLLIDRTNLAEAEAYGECLTHAAGHYERWEEWQALGPALRGAAGYPNLIGSTEYDEWPRGRVVYEVPMRRFVIYADRRLQRPEIIDALKDAYGLTGYEVLIRSDAHYR